MMQGYLSDPSISFCAIGDHTCDSAPLQITSFCQGKALDETLSKVVRCFALLSLTVLFFLCLQKLELLNMYWRQLTFSKNNQIFYEHSGLKVAVAAVTLNPMNCLHTFTTTTAFSIIMNCPSSL